MAILATIKAAQRGFIRSYNYEETNAMAGMGDFFYICPGPDSICAMHTSYGGDLRGSQCSLFFG